MSRVSVNKDLLDNLADSISNKFDEDTPLTLAGMKDVVDDIPKRSSTDLTASGATVTVPAGFYGSEGTKTISSGSATPASSITASTSTPSAQNSKLRLTATASNTPQVSAGYISSGIAGNTSITVDTDIPYYNSNSPITINGNTVSVPRGFFSGNVSKTVPYGTEGTPTATKGTVSNHQVTVTPSVTNTAGYITGGTKTGTAVTVTASELASGSKSISANGTGIDVVGYSTVDVAVPSGGGNVFLVTLEFDDETGYWVPNQTLDDIATAYGQGKTIVVNCDEDISFVSAEGKYWNNYGTFEYFVREEKNNSTVVVVQAYMLYQDDTVALNWEEEYGEITDGNEMYFGDNPEITPYVGYGEVDSAVLR